MLKLWPMYRLNRFAGWIRQIFEARYYPLGYAPSLDGLRGIMTIGVVLTHIDGRYLPGTVLYMDVFFVMSGYYITSLLLRDVEHDKVIRFAAFYRRRFARILPPFVAMIISSLLMFKLMVPSHFNAALYEVVTVVTYTSNWYYAFGGGDLFYAPTWSLSIEEQFYLLWPLTLALLVKRFGITWRLCALISLLAAFVWCWRIGVTATGHYHRVYYSFDTRADSLLVGCALALALRLNASRRVLTLDGILGGMAWPLLIYSVLITFFFYDAGIRYRYFYFGSMICGALPGALLLTVLLRTSGTVLHRVFERPEAVFLGQIFYAIYLWHFPIFQLLTLRWDLQGGVRSLVLLFVGVPLTLAISTLSYVVIERRFMRSRKVHFVGDAIHSQVKS
jgi:peptidoglycan/LPS O-acetylase OafA/YrhL